MGTYPSFAFTPNDDAVIIWAAGQIYHVPLATNSRGERTKSASAPTPIPFIAHVEKRLAETRSSETDLLAFETKDTQRVHALTELRINKDGSKMTFQAAGVNYVYDVETEHVHPVPALHSDAPYFAPSFVPNAEELVVQARWSDTDFTTFELANTTSGAVYELTGLPLGRYYSPVLCECSGSQRKIAFLKQSSGYLSGDIVATANPGLYVGDITLPSGSSPDKGIEIKNVQFVSAAAATDGPGQTKLRFLEKNAKILVQQSSYAFVVDLAAGPDAFGQYKHEGLASGAMSAELVVAPTRKAPNVAFVDFMHVYFAPNVPADEPVWSKPGRATKKLTRLSLDGGHDVVWSGDGKKLFWLLGRYTLCLLAEGVLRLSMQDHICTRSKSRNWASARPRSPKIPSTSGYPARRSSSSTLRSSSATPAM